MKPVFMTVILTLLLLTTPSWAHGGEEHADIREEAAHEMTTSSAVTSAPKSSVQEVSANGDRYVITFTQQPAEPILGQEVQIEANVVQVLNPPDPLLGDKVTVEGAELSVSQSEPTTLPLGDAHAEEQPGSYGIHFTPADGGAVRLSWVLQQADQTPVKFDYSFTVPKPWKVKAAWGFSALVLLAMLIVTLVRRRMLWGAWLAALVICGAALTYAYRPQTQEVKVPAGRPTTPAAEEERGLRIPIDLQRDLEMTIEPVRQTELSRTIRVPGTVRIPEGSTHNLHARFSSRILSETPRIGRVYQRGEQVALMEEVLSTSDRASLRGQSIDLEGRRLEFATRRLELKRQMAELETERQVAASEVTQRELDLSRSKQLYAIQALPKKELQAARTAYDQALTRLAGLKRQQGIVGDSPAIPDLPPPTSLQTYSLIAPVRGAVAKVEAAQGEVVEPSKSLYTLVDLSRVWVEARVSEKDLAAARGAGRAEISTVAYPGPFVGTFVSVAPGLDPETRTALVYFQVDNQDGKLLEGMSAEVDLGGAPEKVLTVPTEALQTFDGESRVFVKIADDRFEALTVSVVRSQGDLSIIEGEIRPGTEIVAKGAGALASELSRRSTGQGPIKGNSPATPAPHGEDEHTH